MSFLWLRHFRYVFVAYVDVFVSHVECCLVSWLSRWFCLLRCSGSCHSYHVAVPRHGMLLAKAWPSMAKRQGHRSVSVRHVFQDGELAKLLARRKQILLGRASRNGFQTPWKPLVASADESTPNCCSTSEVGSGDLRKRMTVSHTCPKLWKQCMRDEVQKKLLRRPLLEDAFWQNSRNAGFKGVVR